MRENNSSNSKGHGSGRSTEKLHSPEIIAGERGLKVNFSQLAEERNSQYTARQLKVGQISSSAEITRYEDKVRQLQDNLFSKGIEHEREIAQLRTEVRAKSA